MKTIKFNRELDAIRKEEDRTKLDKMVTVVHLPKADGEAEDAAMGLL